MPRIKKYKTAARGSTRGKSKKYIYSSQISLPGRNTKVVRVRAVKKRKRKGSK